MKKFDLETLTKAMVAGGVIMLVTLTLFLLVSQYTALIPVVVTTLLGLLTAVVWHYFPKKGDPKS